MNQTIISIKNITAIVSHSTNLNNKIVTDATAMNNDFNNYFTSIAKKSKLQYQALTKALQKLPILYRYKYLFLGSN